MTDLLTPRSQQIWAAELRATAPDRAAIARRAGIPQRTLSRMLSSSSRVPAGLARQLAELCGFTVVPRSIHGFTLEVTP